MAQYQYLIYEALHYVAEGIGMVQIRSSTIWDRWEVVVNRYPLTFLQIALLLTLMLIIVHVWRKRKIIHLQGRSGHWLLWSLRHGQVPKRYREEVEK